MQMGPFRRSRLSKNRTPVSMNLICFKLPDGGFPCAGYRNIGHTHTLIKQRSKNLRLVVPTACGALVPDGWKKLVGESAQ